MKEKTHDQLIEYAINILEEMGYITKGNIHQNRGSNRTMGCDPDTIAEKDGKKIAVECGKLNKVDKVEKYFTEYDEVLWVKEGKFGFDFIFFKKTNINQEKIDKLKEYYEVLIKDKDSVILKLQNENWDKMRFLSIIQENMPRWINNPTYYLNIFNFIDDSWKSHMVIKLMKKVNKLSGKELLEYSENFLKETPESVENQTPKTSEEKSS